MDIVYFLVRYTPWWGVPMLATFLYFSYIYRLKQKHYSSYVFAFGALMAMAFLVYYFYVGGPDRAVQIFKSYVDFLFY